MRYIPPLVGLPWDTSCGGVDGIASKLRTCTCLPPTNLNVCRLRDCLAARPNADASPGAILRSHEAHACA